MPPHSHMKGRQTSVFNYKLLVLIFSLQGLSKGGSPKIVVSAILLYKAKCHAVETEYGAGSDHQRFVTTTAKRQALWPQRLSSINVPGSVSFASLAL